MKHRWNTEWKSAFNPWLCLGIDKSLCRRSIAAKSSQDFVEIGRDGHLVIQKILQPEIITAMGQGNQRQELSQTDANRRLRLFIADGIVR